NQETRLEGQGPTAQESETTVSKENLSNTKYARSEKKSTRLKRKQVLEVHINKSNPIRGSEKLNMAATTKGQTRRPEIRDATGPQP
ncbi:hypothetical protein SESBI_49917, partial [Sesbania bispinosa]